MFAGARTINLDKGVPIVICVVTQHGKTPTHCQFNARVFYGQAACIFYAHLIIELAPAPDQKKKQYQ
ncbi:MAG: hypothetical protein D8M54_22630 [Chloroflexi bacterium]|nr:hypothetical protein [Chloroflexota bacterium]